MIKSVGRTAKSLLAPVRRSARLSKHTISTVSENEVAPIAISNDPEHVSEPVKKRIKVSKSQKSDVKSAAVKATRSVDLAEIPVHPAIPSDKFKGGTINRTYEQQLTNDGLSFCGVDEAGRGPLAGPVVAAACQIDIECTIEGVNDSKLLTEVQREQLFETLISHPKVRYAVRVIEPAVIDEINILQATLRGMRECIDELHSITPFNVAFIDGPISPSIDEACNIEHRCVIKGDSKVYSIAAASIIAKVTRDRLMNEYHVKFPVYNFIKHKGYGVAAHLQAIKQHGPCEIHRMTFAPMKHMKPSAPKISNVLNDAVNESTNQTIAQSARELKTDIHPPGSKKRASRSRKT